jgi:hypothetical protein
MQEALMSQSASRRSNARKARKTTLVAELGRKLTVPKNLDSAPLLDAHSPAFIGLKPRKRTDDLAPHRLAWIGAVLCSPARRPTPYIEALVVPLEEDAKPSPMSVKALPIKTLTALNALRGRKKNWSWDLDEPSSPPVEKRDAPKEWTLYVWFGGPDTCVATVDDVPALKIATPPHEQSLARTAFCVILDRPARRVAIIPCWEIFRYYYAWSEQVASAVFAFPRWRPGTLTTLLAWFDGHRFRRARIRKRWARADAEYATAQLQAIGRDASVSYVRTGRAEIRALPPFVGPVRIGCTGIPLRFGRFSGFLLRLILSSLPRCDADRSLRWW